MYVSQQEKRREQEKKKENKKERERETFKPFHFNGISGCIKTSDGMYRTSSTKGNNSAIYDDNPNETHAPSKRFTNEPSETVV